MRRLLCIPYKGAATKGEVLEAISQLPKRGKEEDGDTWPYLEIRLLETQPEPELLYQVTEALADRAVHFCRIVRVLPENEQTEESEPQFHETLQSLTPIEMAHRVFSNRYNSDMPEEMEKRFKEAEQLSLNTPS